MVRCTIHANILENHRDILDQHFVVFLQNCFVQSYEQIIQILNHELFSVNH